MPLLLGPSVKLYYQLTIRDAQGRVIRRTRRRPSQSFVRQYIDMIRHRMRTGNNAITDTTNTSRTLTNAQQGLNALGPVGDATYGLVVGTGSTAVAISDYALGTQIAQGTGSGQLDHQAASFSAVSVSAPDAEFSITRVFINSSGASITINEVGIYTLGSTYSFLVVRDIVSGGFDVPNGGSATLEYTLKITA